MSMYKIHHAVPFEYAIMEVTRLVQIALHIFGLYPLRQCDGLLCDETVGAIERYVAASLPNDTDVMVRN